MQEKINEKTFEGQSIYVGIDVHKKDWKVTIMTAELSYKTFSSVPKAEKLAIGTGATVAIPVLHSAHVVVRGWPAGRVGW